ncbi:hypothetical protein M422DRAFT_260833 [Sphaerobolus stellatus SS14]|uniref:Uncharacterized protein n=1 Tax=Sphaerobolus stellatus (strain SS14) TaxID=990650 RepID=A0A0C9VGL2_SPHS4|nr:hypothetical protein M422DRAFT_260833 [Sphaerobolus stellatus SS14]
MTSPLPVSILWTMFLNRHEILRPLQLDSSFTKISGILRASTQYEFPRVRELALSCFSKKYSRRPAPYECAHWTHLQEAAQLALDCRLQELLPSLLYGVILISDFHVEEDLISPTGISTPHVDNEVPATSYLHTVCGRLIKKIIHHFAPVLFTVATGDHMECTELLADHWMNLAIQPAIDDSGVYKPLETLKRIQNIDWASLGLCEECCKAKREEWDEEADSFWSKLEEWTKLDSDIYLS